MVNNIEMKVICVIEYIDRLTLGKTYDSIEYYNKKYYIKDDTDYKRWYNTNRFILLEEERARKLKELGI